MASPLYVGIGHQKRQGKDTFARMLHDHLDPIAAVLAFATPLKDLAIATFGLDGLGMYGDLSLPCGIQWADARATFKHDGLPWTGEMSYRDILQAMGAAVRQGCPGLFANAPFRNTFPERIKVVIISDVRYRNEAEAIRDRGGYLIRVVRPGVGVTDPHASETQLKGYTDWNLTVLNRGSLTDLDNQAFYVAANLRNEIHRP